MSAEGRSEQEANGSHAKAGASRNSPLPTTSLKVAWNAVGREVFRAVEPGDAELQTALAAARPLSGHA
ncbi:hypothetical protein [Arthrobacter sp. VKM Ac-2550]|uniref:hypothetical protein n=1 Tax=Crystallibacter permensis TaxID=1938888 RepID=UPI002227E6D5|nr:hypothetical protein [Arthrobacter sp. VKM Ac-2550]